jgi:hypothetical protein
MSPPGELAMFLAVGLIGYSLLFGPSGSPSKWTSFAAGWPRWRSA